MPNEDSAPLVLSVSQADAPFKPLSRRSAVVSEKKA